MHNIVEKFLKELENQLLERHVKLKVTAPAKEWLAVKGYDKRMGARPLARVIQEAIKKPVSDQLLFGKLKDGGTLEVGANTEGLSFKYSSLKKKVEHVSALEL